MATNCPELICVVPDDLQSCTPIYADAPISLLVNCPTGYYCPPGLFPRVVTYQIADLPAIPVCIFSETAPIVLAIQGCSGLISRTLPAGSSDAAIHAAVQSIIGEWATQQSICDVIDELDGIIKTGFVGNDKLIFNCDGDGVRDPFESPVVTNMARGDNIINIHVINNTDFTIHGNEFTFNNGGGDVHGTVDVPAHTTGVALSVLPGSANPWQLRRDGSLFFSQGGLPPGQDVFYQQDGAAMPPGLIFDSVNHSVYVPSNFFMGTTKAEANAKAQAYLDAKVAEYIASGFLACL